MSTKHKSALKQLFNAWLKFQKKDAEAFKLKCYKFYITKNLFILSHAKNRLCFFNSEHLKDS